MKQKDSDRFTPIGPNSRKTSRVRVTEADPPCESASRRDLLRFAAHGAAVPAVFMLGGLGAEVHAGATKPAEGLKHPRAGAAPGVTPTPGRIVRDFSDPYLELVRLLHEAAEIEHSLMIQYLYCAFSVKPIYAGVVGYGAPNTNDLLGVCIQEMQHLGKVNQFLVALGAAPTLVREDFPYEPEIYPFRFNLEPASRASLAKYAWTEAPLGATDVRNAKTPADRAFCVELVRALDGGVRPNYVGSLYDAVIAAVEELIAARDKSLPDLQPWIGALHQIKQDGEIGHFQFFKRFFMGTHEGFGGRPNVWNRAVSDPHYPARQLPINPTAYVGHEKQIQDPDTLALAWLGNLHYWIMLSLLAQGYGRGSREHVGLAMGHMMGPFWSLARKLASVGAGMPFDPLSLGYTPCVSGEANSRFVARLLGEADKLEKQLGARLPADFPAGCCRGTRAAHRRLESLPRLGRVPTHPWDDGLGRG
ncbi:MAG: hypothetical protein HYU75_24835 [Betaproteobacteria bacterium]|nr:hypothetical protein [Betaproteobacteria bacterium]